MFCVKWLVGGREEQTPQNIASQNSLKPYRLCITNFFGMALKILWSLCVWEGGGGGVGLERLLD